MQEDTIVEYASCFDLTLHVSKDDRIELARKLYQIYGKEYSHGIVDDGTHLVEHDAALIASWSVTIKYHPKIECTEDEFIAEFEKLWPVFNRNWGKFKDKTDALQKLYCYIIDNYMINFPHVCEMPLILMAAASNTGPLDRTASWPKCVTRTN